MTGFVLTAAGNSAAVNFYLSAAGFACYRLALQWAYHLFSRTQTKLKRTALKLKRTCTFLKMDLVLLFIEAGKSRVHFLLGYIAH